MPITFGTDGWRGIISDDYTFENVKIVTQAFADYLKEPVRPTLPIYHLNGENTSYKSVFQPHTQGIIIGYDSRFLSGTYAELAARVIQANGIPVKLCDKTTPTPIVSFGIQYFNTAGGIVITASHNPYQWNGFKVKMEYAGSATPEVTKEIERNVACIQSGCQDCKDITIQDTFSGETISLFEPYMERLNSLVDIERIQNANFTIVSDPLYGAAKGFLQKILPKVCIYEIHNEENPCFGGLHPEPIEPYLAECRKALRRKKASVALAFDGDSDRIGAMDKTGMFLSSHDIFTLLLWYLVKKRNWSGGAAKTFSTTQRIKLLSELLGVPYYETPVGFKNICHLMLTKDILIGGEESGGIGIKKHIPERDSLLNGLLLLEMMAVTGKSLKEILEDIHKEIGSFFCDRIDLHVSDNEFKEKILQSLKDNPAAKINQIPVNHVDTLDGVKYLLDGNRWLLFRASGTEPLIRIYAEAENKVVSRQLLKVGERLIRKESAC